MADLTAKEAAYALGVNVRTVQLAVQEKRINGYFVKGKGRKGQQLRITLESLPEDAQARYRGEQKPSNQDILQYSGKQRETDDFRLLVVLEYQHSSLSLEEFVQQFNAENPPKEAITTSKLFRWQRQYKQGGVAALIDQRGGYNRGQDTIPPEAWDLFYSLYMTQQKRKVKLCYDLTKLEYPDIPSVSSFERKVRKIPQYAILYYREGPKAYEDALPAMTRTKLDIASNDIWFSDHHLVDTFVKSADGQRIVRPWLTVFFDARSNKVMSFIVRNADPNTTVVKQCFRKGVEEWGIPIEVYFDNGKDYRSKKAFGWDYPMSLVNQLGIGMIYAKPYHGQAKTVERFFGTFTDRFSRRFPTYTGRNAKDRPECMQINNKEILQMAPALDEYIQAVGDYIDEYNNTPSSGRDMEHKCPNQVYQENLTTKRVISDFDALRLLCGNSEERVVNKSGVSIMNNSYFNDQLLPHLGERVIVTYDPANIDKVAVFDMDNHAICMAAAKILTPFRHTTEEDYTRAGKEKKAARAIVREYAPKRDMNIREIISRNQLMEVTFQETGEPYIVEQITPKAARNAEILKETDTTARGRRIREEDSITAILSAEYQKQA